MDEFQKIVLSVFLMIPFISVTWIILEEKAFEKVEITENYNYTFENANIKEAYQIGDTTFVIQNYTDFKNYSGEIYVFTKEGEVQGGGFWSKPHRYNSQLQIYYIENSVMYGISYEGDYNDPLEYEILNKTIYVEKTDYHTQFNLDMFMIAIFIEIVGIWLIMKIMMIKNKKEDE